MDKNYIDTTVGQVVDIIELVCQDLVQSVGDQALGQ